MLESCQLYLLGSCFIWLIHPLFILQFNFGFWDIIQASWWLRNFKCTVPGLQLYTFARNHLQINVVFNLSAEATSSWSELSGPNSALCYSVYINIILTVWKNWKMCCYNPKLYMTQSWLRNWLQMPGSWGIVQRVIGDYHTSGFVVLICISIEQISCFLYVLKK